MHDCEGCRGFESPPLLQIIESRGAGSYRTDASFFSVRCSLGGEEGEDLSRPVFGALAGRAVAGALEGDHLRALNAFMQLVAHRDVVGLVVRAPDDQSRHLD